MEADLENLENLPKQKLICLLKNEFFINSFFIDLITNHIIIKNTDPYATIILEVIRKLVLDSQSQDGNTKEKNASLHRSIRHMPHTIASYLRDDTKCPDPILKDILSQFKNKINLDKI